MKREFVPERRPELLRWAFLGAVGVALGINAFFGYLAGMTIAEGWGGLAGTGLAADAQYVGALALVEGVLMVLLIVLAVAFSRVKRPGARTVADNQALKDEIGERRWTEEGRDWSSSLVTFDHQVR